MSRENKRSLFLMLMKADLFALVALSFFLTMGLNTPYLLNISRTAAIVAFGFTVLFLLFMNIYQGFDMQHEQSRHIIFSTIISVLFTDAGAFIELMIMNFNENNRSTLVPEWADIGCLGLCLLLQILWIVFYTRATKFIYYRMTPPRRSCVVFSEGADLAQLSERLASYRKRYIIETAFRCDESDILERIGAYDQVFLYGLSNDQRNRLVRYCYEIRKPVQYVMELMDVISQSGTAEILDDVPFVSIDRPGGLTLEQRMAKRALDIVFSLLAILLFWPLMLGCAAAIRLEDGGPALFRQERATLNGRVFNIHKFRTMRVGADSGTSVHDDDSRITRVGRVLRRWRLDELPQVIDILKGDMSVVGPRPEMLPNVLEYTKEMPEFSYRLRVKAGLTGYAQIAGKYNTSPRDKMLMDLMYIDHYSLLADIKLILRTITVFNKPDSTAAFGRAGLDGGNTGSA
ncbi:MAG: sugar transferase, partial [Clostridia bacterium]|nr:sugar transferase [Clostridia bacterium]